MIDDRGQLIGHSLKCASKSGSWLTAIPNIHNGTILSAEEFWDNIRLWYCMEPKILLTNVIDVMVMNVVLDLQSNMLWTVSQRISWSTPHGGGWWMGTFIWSGIINYHLAMFLMNLKSLLVKKQQPMVTILLQWMKQWLSKPTIQQCTTWSTQW